MFITPYESGLWNSIYYVSILFGGISFLITLPRIIRGFREGRKKDLFECSLCGNCCRFKFIDATEEDIGRLREAGYEDFVDDSGKFMKRVNGRCVFLEDDKCSVHEVRPKVCREFPFQKMYGMWFCQKAYFCPGMEEFREDGSG